MKKKCLIDILYLTLQCVSSQHYLKLFNMVTNMLKLCARQLISMSIGIMSTKEGEL